VVAPKRMICAALAVACVVGVDVGGVMTARAQTALEDSVARRPRPDFEPIGIVAGPAGSFLLFPALELQTRYTDNLFSTDSGTISDEIFVIKPEIKLRSDWDNHALNLAIGARNAHHVENPNEDWTDANFNADGRYDIADLGRLRAALTLERRHEARSSPDDPGNPNPTIFYRGVAEIGGEYNPDALLLRLAVKAQRHDFRNNGSTNNDDRDRTIVEVRGRAGYEFTPGTTAFVEGALDNRDFDQKIDDAGFKRSSDGYEVLAGMTLDLSGVTFAELGVGYRRQRFDDPLLSDVQGISFAGRLLWNPTDLLSLSARLRRLINETTLSGASGVFTSVFSLKADYEAADNLLFDAKVTLTLQEFDGIQRQDDSLSFEFGGKYLIGPNLYAGARYSLENRASDAIGSDFTENRIRVFIGARL